MRRLTAILIASIGLAVAMLGGAGAWSVPVKAGSPKNLPTLAYFYQWFNESSWDRAKVDFPLAGRYSSDDTAVMRRQVAEAKHAGINGFIVSWKDSPVNNRRLERMMKVSRENDFKLAVIYQGLDFHRKPLPITRVAADLDLFNTKYAPDPVFRIFDKPLVLWSGTWKFSAKDIEATTRPLRSTLYVLATEKSSKGYERVAASFDGDAYYWSSVDPETNGGYSTKLAQMGKTVHASGGLWLAPFAPGFDARLVGGTREVPRRDGDTLQAEYNTAISSSPDALGLISWNEFSENTHVEPSERYGSSPLTALAGILKGTDVSVSPLAADSDGLDTGNGGMTVQSGLILLLLLMAGVTVAGVLRRRRDASHLDDRGKASGSSTRSRGIVRARLPRARYLLSGLLVVATVVTVVVNVPRGRAVDVTGPSPQYRGVQPIKNPDHAIVTAAGDISCPTNRSRLGEELGPKSCQMKQTADLITSVHPDAVLALGDNQYPSGSLADFEANYAHTWGAFRDITFPVPGNHEYGTPDAKGYYAYFGRRAGEPDKGYYSYDLGSWHVIALNSECLHIGGCSDTSPQAIWLKNDLAAHPRTCTLAYWHRPRFSSGAHGNNLDNDSLWRILVAARVDLVLNGHDHDYERFTAMNADGDADPANGTAEIIVGTGGASHYKFHLPAATSVERIAGENGVARLDLSANGYSWNYLQAPQDKSLDAGQGTCH
jgi:hypothetical protein